jgi:hypothetical protein
MSARVDVPASDGSTGVLVDGKSVAATKSSGRWVISDDITGSVVIDVK